MKKGTGYTIGWILRGIIGVTGIYFLLQGNVGLFGIMLMSGGASILVHSISKHHFGYTGEWLDALFGLLIVFNNVFGLGFDFYHTLPYWDIVTHYTTSIFLGVTAIILLQKGYPLILKEAPTPILLLAMVLFSTGLGAIWEIGEFSSDFLQGTDFQGGLVNTMQDLVVDLLAGLIVGIAWVNVHRTKKPNR